MKKDQILQKISDLEKKISEQEEEKETFLVEISTAEAEIKIKKNKVIKIDEKLLEDKEELKKFKNCIEILER